MNEQDARLQKAFEMKRAREVMQERVKVMKEKGYSNVAIGEELELSESTVRVLLKDASRELHGS